MAALRYSSILLFAAGVALAQNPPAADEQTAVIAATREGALRFSDKLPDFICTQVTRRWVGSNQAPTTMIFGGRRMAREPETIRTNEDFQWKLKDTLTIQLTYFGQKEQYKLLLVNGAQAKQSYESVDGTTSYGDFGSLLGIVFQDSAQAAFKWDHWGVLNGETVMVYGFEVAAAHSQWRIGYGTQEIITGIKGFVFIEPKSKQVLKLEVNAADIPKKFPIQRSGVELDYRMQSVGVTEYLLPLKAVNWSDAKNVRTKNELEFRKYRKFSADSKLDFDTPAPLPERQVKEAEPK